MSAAVRTGAPLSSLRNFRFLVLTLLLLILGAELVLRVADVPSYILPLPSSVGRYIVSQPGFLLGQTAITMGEAFVGFLLANAVAYLLACAFAISKRIEGLGMPMAVAVKATPVVALAPLFVVWFGNGAAGKCLMAALVCFFPMLVNATSGLRAVPPDVMAYLRSLGSSKRQILIYARIPASLPYVFAAAKASSTISIVGALVAELSGSDAGIGHLLLVSIYQLDTDVMFAGIACIALFGVAFYGLIAQLEHVVLERSLGLTRLGD